MSRSPEHIEQQTYGKPLTAVAGGDHPLRLAPQAIWEISSALQVTLEPARIISIFNAKAREYVPHDGMQWHPPEIGAGTKVEIGEATRHSCEYSLVVERDDLGRLTLQRANRFSRADLDAIEHLICGLIYPLRNALHHQRVLKSAFSDALTGLHNRNALNELVPREIALAHRHGTPLSMLVMDLDHFKQINDQLGHAAGDDAIRLFARIVRDLVRDTDLSFRFGGEEFVLVLPNTGAQGAEHLAERIRTTVASTGCCEEMVPGGFSVSIGVAQLMVGESVETLFQRADDALYRAKEAGRNCVMMASDLCKERKIWA